MVQVISVNECKFTNQINDGNHNYMDYFPKSHFVLMLTMRRQDLTISTSQGTGTILIL